MLDIRRFDRLYLLLDVAVSSRHPQSYLCRSVHGAASDVIVPDDGLVSKNENSALRSAVKSQNQSRLRLPFLPLPPVLELPPISKAAARASVRTSLSTCPPATKSGRGAMTREKTKRQNSVPNDIMTKMISPSVGLRS